MQRLPDCQGCLCKDKDWQIALLALILKCIFKAHASDEVFWIGLWMSRRHLKYLTRDFWKRSSFKVVTARQLGSVSSVFFYSVLQTDWRADKSDWTQTRIFNDVWSKRMFNENADTDSTSSIWLFLQSNYTIKIITENMPLPPARQKENRSTIYRDKMLELLEISLIKYSCIFFHLQKSQDFMSCMHL